jgi:phosphate transport system substrate-binding protein
MTPRERRTVRFRLPPRLLLLALAVSLVAVVAAGCGREEDDEGGNAPAAGADGGSEEQLSGAIEIDGSSTVGPLVTAAAEQFRGQQPDVEVRVGTSGTGGGFERFCAGETDVSNASRQIDEEEVPICEENGIAYTELQVAVDALTVVVNAENDWATCLTTEQLKKIWAPSAEGKVTNWNQVDPSFPDQQLSLAGPGTDSGTFDYFTDEINGEEGASRSDYQASEDDNVIVQAVQGERGALGYFGFSYYEENQDTLRAVEIDSGNGCVAPSVETAQAGDYTPLSRPLFIYVKNESLDRPEVEAFTRYMVDNAVPIAEQARFIPLNDEQLAETQATFEEALAAR